MSGTRAAGVAATRNHREVAEPTPAAWPIARRLAIADRKSLRAEIVLAPAVDFLPSVLTESKIL